jgi:hypothetical protein
LVRETTKEGQRILLQVIFGVTIGKHEELDAIICADIVDQRVFTRRHQTAEKIFSQKSSCQRPHFDRRFLSGVDETAILETLLDR